MNYVEIGPSPVEEDCVQMGVGTAQEMIDECNRFKELLERLFPVPEGINAYYHVKRFPYDLNSYYEVVVVYDDEDDESTDFAYNVCDNQPLRWSDSE